MQILEKFRYCPVCGSKHFDINGPKSKLCSNCGLELFENPSSSVAAFIVNDKGELLVEKRKLDPAKGTFDLPGGFCDANENLEEAIRREVREETHLEVKAVSYFCSEPNKYRFSGLDIPTLDAFFECTVSDFSTLKPDDDARECLWLPLTNIHTELFGMRSVRFSLHKYLDSKGIQLANASDDIII